MTLIKIFNEGSDELLNCFPVHFEFAKQDFNFFVENI